MPDPGDEHAAGDVPPEVTPLERLRFEGDVSRMAGHAETAAIIASAAIAAWEADVEHLRIARKTVKMLRDVVISQEARIEALEENVAEWEAAAQYAFNHYPEDIFPVEGTSQDAKAGAFARRLMGWLLDPAERKKWAALAAKDDPPNKKDEVGG